MHVHPRFIWLLSALVPALLLFGAISTALVGAQAADSDHDGLLDIDETGVYGTLPSQADSDGDGLGDGEEVYLGTNPRVPNERPAPVDSDGDGLYDQDEASIYGTDPSNSDTDGDTTGDGSEVGMGTDPRVPNGSVPPPVADTDGDGIDDKRERDNGTDPQVPDAPHTETNSPPPTPPPPGS